MDCTKKTVKASLHETELKIQKLHKLLISMNAYGSLCLDDLEIIEDYLKGAFGNHSPFEEVTDENA